jgi:hypothetical protein
MLRVTPEKSSLKSKARFLGIVRDARRLGVSRVHLYLVLSGKRHSNSLLRRYRSLQNPHHKVS